MKRAVLLLALATLLPAAAAQTPSVDELLARAKKRDAEAEYTLGRMAYEGRGVPRNPSQARRLMERAAIRGHLDAQNILGFFHQHGVGGPVDLEKAREWYEAAADRGHALAQANAGWMAQEGLGGRQDAVAALTWYRKAAEQGVIEAEWNAAHLLERGGFGQLPDPEAAAEAYARTAGRYPLAAFRIAQMLERKTIPARKDGTALDRYLQAAGAGMPEAQFAAGRLLLASGNPAATKEAVEWLAKATAAGLVEARKLLVDPATQARIAGLGRPQETFPWLRDIAARLAQGEVPDAQFAAGRLLLATNTREGAAQAIPWLEAASGKGQGEARAILADAETQFRIAGLLGPADAVPWLRRAAAREHGHAMLALAEALEAGRGTARNPAEAAQWYQKLAAAGSAEAHFRLGLMYDAGTGLPENPTRARDAFARAAEMGHEGAKARMARMLDAGFPRAPDAGDPFKGLR